MQIVIKIRILKLKYFFFENITQLMLFRDEKGTSLFLLVLIFFTTIFGFPPFIYLDVRYLRNIDTSHYLRRITYKIV